MFWFENHRELNGSKRCLVVLCFLLVSLLSSVRLWAQNIPRPPNDLKATIVSKEMIELAWRDNSENEDGFRIYCNSTLIGSVGKNITTFQHKDPEPGKLQRYEVRAFNSSGESESASLLETPPYEEHY